MKKLSMLFAALLLAGGGVMFTGCSDDDEPTPTPANSLMLTDASGAEITSVEIPAAGGSAKVYVKTDGSWDIALAEQDWCDAEKGATRVTVTADANETGEDRSTTLTVTAGELKKSVTVTQPSNGEPIYQASYDSFLGNWTLTATMDGETELTYAINISAGDDYVVDLEDGSSMTLKGYDIKGWGSNSAQLTQAHPAYGVFMPSQEDQNVGYLYMLGQEYGQVTADVPTEEGGTKSVTATFYFGPLCVNINDTSKSTVFIGEPIMFICGFLSDNTTFAFANNIIQSTDGQQWAAIAAGYFYEIDASTVGFADDMLSPISMVKANGTASMASVSALSSYSSGAKYAKMATSTFKTKYTSFNLTK